jgi:hypothetical protein
MLEMCRQHGAPLMKMRGSMPIYALPYCQLSQYAEGPSVQPLKVRGFEVLSVASTVHLGILSHDSGCGRKRIPALCCERTSYVYQLHRCHVLRANASCIQSVHASKSPPPPWHQRLGYCVHEDANCTTDFGSWHAYAVLVILISLAFTCGGLRNSHVIIDNTERASD